MDKRTQHKRILAHLLGKGGMTPMDAFYMVPPITKLATRVGELRRDGAVIGDTWINTEYKHNVCKRYFLISLKDYKGNL